MILSFNYTAAIEDDTLMWFNLGFVIIIFVNTFSILYYIMNVWIDIRIGKFDTNVLKIHQFIYITCPIFSTTIIVQKVMIIGGIPAGYKLDNNIFFILHHLKTATMFPGLICLMAFVIERFCATIFLKDYEKRNRCWIGMSVGIGLYTVSGLLAYSLAMVATSLYHTIFLLAFSTSSCMGNVLNYRINRKHYKRCQKSFDGKYSLAERYQISNNIQFSFFFNRFASSIFFFTVLCPLLMLAASFDISIVYRNLFISLFELSFSLYTIMTPYIIYKFNIRWQQEYQKIKENWLSRFKTKRVDVTSSFQISNDIRLRDTFGIEMNIEIQRQSDTYFDQLQSTWNIRTV
uniref:Uncharacterized protein n=1 Tax=Caenorhabditis japonica TaxID=281687 RepID=A0A8R1DEJ1_CAEJA